MPIEYVIYLQDDKKVSYLSNNQPLWNFWFSSKINQFSARSNYALHSSRRPDGVKMLSLSLSRTSRAKPDTHTHTRSKGEHRRSCVQNSRVVMTSHIFLSRRQLEPPRRPSPHHIHQKHISGSGLSGRSLLAGRNVSHSPIGRVWCKSQSGARNPHTIIPAAIQTALSWRARTRVSIPSHEPQTLVDSEPRRTWFLEHNRFCTAKTAALSKKYTNRLELLLVVLVERLHIHKAFSQRNNKRSRERIAHSKKETPRANAA